MLGTLAKIYDDGGPLIGAMHALVGGDPRFIAAVELRFESFSVIFRAVPNDDTLAVNVGSLVPEPDEVLSEAADRAPWSVCVGHDVSWAWRLTNQQGYADGVRLEFDARGEASRATVELIVTASAIKLHSVVPCAVA